MWEYVLDLMVKADNVKDIIVKLEAVIADLKKGKKSEETCTDKVECEWELRGGE